MTGCVPINSAIKKTAHASEQERSDVRAARTRWRKRQDWLKQHLHLLGRVVFLDDAWLLFLPPLFTGPEPNRIGLLKAQSTHETIGAENRG